MLHFSALVCPGLPNPSGKGPSLALLVMLIINNHSKETGVTVARGAAIASLAAAGISCQGGDLSLCHRSLTNLGPIWDIQKRTGSRAVGAVGAWAPVPCLRRQALTGASYGALVARWVREIRSQQRWAAALPSVEGFERV